MVCKICSVWNIKCKKSFYPFKENEKLNVKLQYSVCGRFVSFILSITVKLQNLIYSEFLQLIFFFFQQRQTDMQGISCLDAQRGKNKSGPCFLSKRQHKLNHADSVSSTNWTANWHLCAPHNKLSNLLSPRNYMCILLICFAIYVLWKT